MSLRTLAALAAIALAAQISTQVSARAPAPLVPIALVEDVHSATAGVEFMDYVGAGQVIKLGSRDTLVLSYLTSCTHETITGGTVAIGFGQSNVQDGEVVRTKVPCDGGNVQLTAQEADKSAASAFRVQSADIHPTIYGRSPVVQLPKDLAREDRVLVIARTDRKGEVHTLVLDDMYATAGYVDLALLNVTLATGGVYEASIGTHKLTFAVAADAAEGRPPVVSRLLRLP